MIGRMTTKELLAYSLWVLVICVACCVLELPFGHGEMSLDEHISVAFMCE